MTVVETRKQVSQDIVTSIALLAEVTPSTACAASASASASAAHNSAVTLCSLSYPRTVGDQPERMLGVT